MNEAYKQLDAIILETARKLDSGEISPQDAMRIVKESRRELEELEAQEAESELLSFFNTQYNKQINPDLIL